MQTELTLRDVKQALRAGEYAWPGGYPQYMITSDGAALSFAAVRECFRTVCADMLGMSHMAQFRIVGIDVNLEDDSLYCDHTGERIPSAYGDND